VICLASEIGQALDAFHVFGQQLARALEEILET
jgi:hypothetical protein